MNKDKAIQLLERLQDPEPYEPMLTKDAYDAIQMAIDALSADGDTISREAAIDAINHELRCGAVIDQCGLETAHDLIEELPPAQPERIKGHWIESNGLNILMKKFIEKGETWRVCDKCGAGFMIGYQYECDKLYHETFHNFCPNCGAEMEVTT